MTRKMNSAKPGSEGADQNTNGAEFSPRSTATEAQRGRILDALRAGPKTSEQLRRLGCFQAPARIFELRNRFGYEIETDLVNLIDADGYAHARCARYTLRAEPGA